MKNYIARQMQQFMEGYCYYVDIQVSDPYHRPTAIIRLSYTLDFSVSQNIEEANPHIICEMYGTEKLIGKSIGDIDIKDLHQMTIVQSYMGSYPYKDFERWLRMSVSRQSMISLCQTPETDENAQEAFEALAESWSETVLLRIFGSFKMVNRVVMYNIPSTQLAMCK